MGVVEGLTTPSPGSFLLPGDPYAGAWSETPSAKWRSISMGSPRGFAADVPSPPLPSPLILHHSPHDARCQLVDAVATLYPEAPKGFYSSSSIAIQGTLYRAPAPAVTLWSGTKRGLANSTVRWKWTHWVSSCWFETQGWRASIKYTTKSTANRELTSRSWGYCWGHAGQEG